MFNVNNISLKVGNFQLKEISFEVEKGDYFVLLGLSGVGKSLLLETISGLKRPDSGTISLRGTDISKLKIQDLNLSIVFQDAVLFPHMTIYENIAYPLKNKSKKEITKTVEELALLVGIKDKLHRNPATLSGGEIQRTALARSLAAGSDIFLLDEPLSSLDSKSAFELRVLLRKLNRSGITIIHVTHNYEEAVSLANKIGIMENGRLVHTDTPQEIFRHPKSEFIAHFIGIKNFIRGCLKTVPGGDLKTFTAGKKDIFTLTDSEDGEAFLMINPEDVILSNNKIEASSRNNFEGTITDIAPARVGIDITVNAGIEIIAAVSESAISELKLEIGNKVWVNFKASSCKIFR